MTTTVDGADHGDPATQAGRRALIQALWPVIPGILLGALDATMVATALGGISADLGHLNLAPWVVTAYLLTASASAVTYGRLGDIHGRRKVLQAATVIFLVGAVAASASRTMGQLVAARAVMGAGGGGLVGLALAALADSVPARVRGRYLGSIGAIFAGSNLAGPLLAGVLLESFGWRSVFLVNVPVAVVGLLTGAMRRGEHERRTDQRLDIPGALLLAAVVTCVLLFLRRVESGVGSAQPATTAVVLAAAGVGGLVWFLARQRRSEHPLVPWELVRNDAFASGLAGIFLGSFVMFASLVYVPLYFQVVSPVDGIAAALLLTPFMVGFLAGTMLPGRTIGRSGRYKRYPVIGSVLMLAGVLSLSSIGPDSVPQARAFLAVTGMGVGLTMQVLLLVVQNGVPHRDVGTATSATALVRAVGGACGIAVFSTVIGSDVLAEIGKNRGGGADLTESLTSGLHSAFLVAALVVVLSLVLAVRLRERPLRESVRGE